MLDLLIMLIKMVAVVEKVERRDNGESHRSSIEGFFFI